MDFGVGDAGMVVDDGVHVGVAQKWVTVFVARLAGVLARFFSPCRRPT
jgi:hypothetical protein